LGKDEAQVGPPSRPERTCSPTRSADKADRPERRASVAHRSGARCGSMPSWGCVGAQGVASSSSVVLALTPPACRLAASRYSEPDGVAGKGRESRSATPLASFSPPSRRSAARSTAHARNRTQKAHGAAAKRSLRAFEALGRRGLQGQGWGGSSQLPPGIAALARKADPRLPRRTPNAGPKLTSRRRP